MSIPQLNITLIIDPTVPPELPEDSEPPPAVSFAETASLYFQCIGGALEFFTIINFFYILSTKKLKPLQGFIILLLVGYIIDLISLLCWAINILVGGTTFLWMTATEISYIYTVISGSLWNTILSLNRCVAVLWPMQHSRYWSIKNIFIFFIPAIMLYPFILQGYLLFNPEFYYNGLTIFTAGEVNSFFTSRLIVGISINVLGAIMMVMTLIVYFKNRKTMMMQAQRWDLNMLIHCSISSFLMFIFSLAYLAAALLYPTYLETAFACEYLSLFLYAVFHYGAIVALFCVNSTIRRSMLQFYTCKKLGNEGPTTVILSSSTAAFVAPRNGNVNRN